MERSLVILKVSQSYLPLFVTRHSATLANSQLNYHPVLLRLGAVI
jgi:hypothetical protein